MIIVILVEFPEKRDSKYGDMAEFPENRDSVVKGLSSCENKPWEQIQA